MPNVPTPFVYKYMKDYGVAPNNDGNYKIGNPVQELDRIRIPGALIMRKYALLARGDVMTAQQKFELLYMAVVEYSRAADWRWLPKTPCGTTKLLDGELTAAECMAFAVALSTLAITPSPLGIGLPAGDGVGNTVKDETYKGVQVRGRSAGFVSIHPRDGVLGLVPNVYTKVGINFPGIGVMRGSGFYMWGNHKVVRFQNKLFDPTYGTQYDNIGDMAFLNVVDWEVLGGEAPATLDEFENMGGLDGRGRYLLICEAADHTRFYMRMTPPTLVGAECQYQGPFTQAQRDWLEAHHGDGVIRADQIFDAA